MNRRDFIKNTALLSGGLFIQEKSDAVGFLALPSLIEMIEIVAISFFAYKVSPEPVKKVSKYLIDSMVGKVADHVIDLMIEHDTPDVWVNRNVENKVKLSGYNNSNEPIRQTITYGFRNVVSNDLVLSKQKIISVSMNPGQYYDDIYHVKDLPFSGVFFLEATDQESDFTHTKKSNKFIIADQKDIFV